MMVNQKGSLKRQFLSEVCLNLGSVGRAGPARQEKRELFQRGSTKMDPSSHQDHEEDGLSQHQEVLHAPGH